MCAISTRSPTSSRCTVSSASVIGLFLYWLSRVFSSQGFALISLCIELYDPVTIMFFFRNKHMMCDFGTGNNNKLNWVLEDKQELIDIIETIYRGAKKGRGLVVSPKDYSTRYRY
jgi:hypothetical protein